MQIIIIIIIITYKHIVKAKNIKTHATISLKLNYSKQKSKKK